MNILLNTNVSENKNTSKNISKNIVTSTTNRNTSKNISTSTSTSSNYKNTNKKLNFNSSPLLRSIKELHDKYPEDGWDKDIELLNNFDVTECPNAMFNTSNYYDDANKSCNNNNKSRNNNRNSCNSCNNDDNTNFINRKNYIKSMHRMKHFVLRTYFYYDDEKSMGRKTVWRRNVGLINEVVFVAKSYINGKTNEIINLTEKTNEIVSGSMNTNRTLISKYNKSMNVNDRNIVYSDVANQDNGCHLECHSGVETIKNTNLNEIVEEIGWINSFPHDYRLQL